MTDTTTCPTCGSPVRVVVADEGTRFYEPSHPTEVHEAADYLRSLCVQADEGLPRLVRNPQPDCPAERRLDILLAAIHTDAEREAWERHRLRPSLCIEDSVQVDADRTILDRFFRGGAE